MNTTVRYLTCFSLITFFYCTIGTFSEGYLNINEWSSRLMETQCSELLGFWTLSICFRPQVRTEIDPVSETVCFVVISIPDDGKSPETQ
jgi:hypothetical protein